MRRSLAESRSKIWDGMERLQGEEPSPQTLAEQTRLLVAFFRSHGQGSLEDARRFDRLAEKLVGNGRNERELQAVMAPYGKKLSNIALDLIRIHSGATNPQLRLLSTFYNPSSRNEEELFQYYTTLVRLLLADNSLEPSETLWGAIAAPLVSSESDNGWSGNLAAYIALAYTILIRPNLSEKDVLHHLASMVDVGILSQAILQDTSVTRLSTMKSEARLWLLSHFIYLHNLRSSHSQEPNYVKALSIMLSFSANDIFGRIEVTQDPSDDMDDEVEERKRPQPLPAFIKTQVVSLVNKNSITGLLAKFDA